jgi:alkaline phosphatase D
MRSALFWFLVSAAYVQAFFDRNINYQSPSRLHDEFGISLTKVQKRLVDAKLSERGAPVELNFTHSVASGDPLTYSVILWTRLAPISNKTLMTTKICLTYKISTSKDFSVIADKGTAYTSSDIDFTVKVEASGLKPFT